MNIHDYYNQLLRYNDELAAKNQAVADFVVRNPDLAGDEIYKQFWTLQNEATEVYKKSWEFCENNRDKVTR